MVSQIHLYIKGDVISVGFRAWLKVQAQMLNLSGWIRNVHDMPELFGHLGGIEAVLQGEQSHLDKLLELVKTVPQMGNIEDVEVMNQEVTTPFVGIELRH